MDALRQRKKTEEETVLYDEQEQEELISSMSRSNAKTDRLFRVFFLIIAVLAGLLFLIFAYKSEQFGEAIGGTLSTILHLLTAIGFFLVAFRCLNGRRNHLVAVGTQEIFNETITGISTRLSSEAFNAYTPDAKRYYARHPEDAPEASSSSSPAVVDNMSPASGVVATPMTSQLGNTFYGSANGSQSHIQSEMSRLESEEQTSKFLGFYLPLIISGIAFCFYLRFMLEAYSSRFAYGLNFKIFVFPFALPVFTLLFEYALSLIQRTEREIQGLRKFTYRYKKL